MPYAEQVTTYSRQGTAIAIAGLLQAALLIGVVKGLAMNGPPQLPRRQISPKNLVTLPLPLPLPLAPLPFCFDCRHPAELSRKPLSLEYPYRDWLERNEGTTAFRLDIDERGKITACRITESSGFVSLDQATCDEIVDRARFKPATDERGRPIPGSFVSEVNWHWDLPRKR